jgi:hypothetical protein
MEENVEQVEIHRAPHNYFDAQLLSDLGMRFMISKRRLPAARIVSV